MPNDGVGSVTLPPLMIELANGLRRFPEELPTGVIVGSAIIEKITPREDGMFQWHLAHVERAKRFRKPKGHPRPVWFGLPHERRTRRVYHFQFRHASKHSGLT